MDHLANQLHINKCELCGDVWDADQFETICPDGCGPKFEKGSIVNLGQITNWSHVNRQTKIAVDNGYGSMSIDYINDLQWNGIENIIYNYNENQTLSYSPEREFLILAIDQHNLTIKSL